jgi:O-antigen/teichoic acid export membrane protein
LSDLPPPKNPKSSPFRRSSLLRQASKYMSAAVISRALATFAVPVLVARLSPDDYGILGLVQGALPVLSLVLTLGVSQVVPMYYFDPRGQTEQRNLLSAIYSFLVCFSAVGICVAFVLVRVVDADTRVIVFSAVLLVILRPHTNAFEAFQRAQENAGRVSITRLVREGVFLFGSVSSVLLFGFGVEGVLISLLLGEVAGLAILNSPSLRNFRNWSRANLARMGEIVRFASPYVLHSGSISFLSYADRWIIGFLLSLQHVGVYTLAYQIAGLVMVPVAAYNEALSPRLLRAYQQDGLEGLSLFHRRSALSYPLVAGAFGCGVAGLAYGYLAYVAPASYEGAILPCVLVISSLVIQAAYMPYINALSALRRSGLIASMSGFAAIANVAANFALIPSLGITGAALATLFSYAILFLVFRQVVQRFLLYTPSWRETISSIRDLLSRRNPK